MGIAIFDMEKTNCGVIQFIMSVVFKSLSLLCSCEDTLLSTFSVGH